MKSVVLCGVLLAAAGGWADDIAEGETDAPEPASDTAETVLRHLAESRKAFEEALGRVEGIEFHQLFDDGAMLGVVIRDDGDEGVRVAGVTPDSGAEAAGVLTGDVIVAINGESLAGETHPGRSLRQAMDAVEPGDTVELVVLRADEEHDIYVKAMRRPHVAGPFHWRGDGAELSFFPAAGKHVRVLRDRAAAAARGTGGLELVDIGEDLGSYFGVDAGVLVLDVPPGSALKPGDIVRRIDDADVSNADDVYRLLGRLEEPGEATVRRQNRARTVEVQPLEGAIARAFTFMTDGSRGDEDEGEEVEIVVEVE